MRVGKKTLSNLAKEGKIPARKIGREWRFVKSVLLDWLSHWGGVGKKSRRQITYHPWQVSQFLGQSLEPLYINEQKLKFPPKKK
ncbi:MAG TPA: hypothetical protein DHV62_06370 [Elusimicrobia bacterium]|nr:hypothetical protein [Elusimicrobiota bacterium]